MRSPRLYLAGALSLLLLSTISTAQAADDNYTLAGKTIYFLVADRFARSGGQATNTTFCDNDADWTTRTNGGYCGGTLKGVESKLDYIAGMGFDCIWITPPIKSADYTGYSGSNFFEIDLHFGTEQDLHDLSASLRSRGMCLVLDFVANHAQALDVNDTVAVSGVHPFNEPAHYHQLDIGVNQTFDDYVLNGTAPDPSAGTGSTPQFYELVQAGEAKCGPDHGDATLCDCFPGNFCPGSDEPIQLEGWFGNAYGAGLADLNQTNAFVRQQLLDYVSYLKTFDVGGFRLDTAIYMEPEFLRELQQTAGVDILGETTVNNLTYHGSFQRDSDGNQVLSGLLNFPPFYYVSESFCGYIMTQSFNPNVKSTFNATSGSNSARGTWAVTPDLRDLASVMDLQQNGDYYANLDLLGNFVDNHDEWARVGRYCQSGKDEPLDEMRWKNTLTWLFMTRGIPILFYGTEQGLAADQDEYKSNTLFAKGGSALRESLWQTGYDTSTWQYQFIKTLNSVRKEFGVGVGKLEIQNAAERSLVFTRESDNTERTHPIWIFLNNFGADEDVEDVIVYCLGPPSVDGHTWYNVLTDPPTEAFLNENGCRVASDTSPQVLVLLPADASSASGRVSLSWLVLGTILLLLSV